MVAIQEEDDDDETMCKTMHRNRSVRGGVVCGQDLIAANEVNRIVVIFRLVQAPPFYTIFPMPSLLIWWFECKQKDVNINYTVQLVSTSLRFAPFTQ